MIISSDSILRKTRVIGAIVIGLILDDQIRGVEERSPNEKKETGLTESQKSFNEEYGANVIQTRDSPLATENFSLNKRTSYDERVDSDAKKLVDELSEAKSLDSAKKTIEKLFSSDASRDLKTQGRKAALSKLASLAEEEGRLEASQQYLAEYVKRFPDDVLIPVILLRQGNIYRKMGAYDLERQKYYDAINAAPRVELDGTLYDLKYVKRTVLIAESQIAESFFDEAKKLPPKLALESFGNSKEMFERIKTGAEQDGSFDEELSEEMISLKLIRALHELSVSKKNIRENLLLGGAVDQIEGFKEVIEEGERFVEITGTAPKNRGEVLYYILNAEQNLKSGHERMWSVFKEFTSLVNPKETPKETIEKVMPWVLKGAGELGQSLYTGRRFEDAKRVFEKQAELISGATDGTERLMEILYGLKYVSTVIDEKEEEPASWKEEIWGIEKRLTHISEISKDLGLEELTDLGSMDAVDSYPKLKKKVAEAYNIASDRIGSRFRSVFPVLYKIGLCDENIPGNRPINVFEKIPIGVLQFEPIKGEISKGDYLESPDKSIKFHVLELLDDDLFPDTALVCHWEGDLSKGTTSVSKDGESEVKAVSFLASEAFMDRKRIGDGTLSLKLIKDMAVWRINNLMWLSEFDVNLDDVE